jgi:hypothetical protein
MDYAAHYQRLMDRAPKYRKKGVYLEQHHIIPRCMGGTNDKVNLVYLTPEEHYVAHQLLVKMYPGNHKLAYAAQMMGGTRKSNKLYGWIKRKCSEAGRSEEFKAKMKRIMNTPEYKAKISAALKGRVFTDEHIMNLSAAKKAIGSTYLIGKKKSAATRAKQSYAVKHSPKAIAQRKRKADAERGKPNGRKGIKQTPEAYARIIAGQQAYWARKKAA